mmetsp:Transcript_120352/g.340532  ORF Transcript_120352/g.340532 Transcript_120352/m.340532 type:complete len:422 (-) Transcript_120352:318-1583(-)
MEWTPVCEAELCAADWTAKWWDCPAKCAKCSATGEVRSNEDCRNKDELGAEFRCFSADWKLNRGASPRPFPCEAKSEFRESCANLHSKRNPGTRSLPDESGLELQGSRGECTSKRAPRPKRSEAGSDFRCVREGYSSKRSPSEFPGAVAEAPKPINDLSCNGNGDCVIDPAKWLLKWGDCPTIGQGGSVESEVLSDEDVCNENELHSTFRCSRAEWKLNRGPSARPLPHEPNSVSRGSCPHFAETGSCIARTSACSPPTKAPPQEPGMDFRGPRTAYVSECGLPRRPLPHETGSDCRFSHIRYASKRVASSLASRCHLGDSPADRQVWLAVAKAGAHQGRGGVSPKRTDGSIAWALFGDENGVGEAGTFLAAEAEEPPKHIADWSFRLSSDARGKLTSNLSSKRVFSSNEAERRAIGGSWH